MRAGIRSLHASLTEAGIAHVYYESPGTDHEWQTWRRNLNDFAPRLFRTHDGTEAAKSRSALIALASAALRRSPRSRPRRQPVVPGAKPVAVERVKIHGVGPRGQPRRQLRSIGTCSSSCPRATRRRKPAAYPVVYALHGYSIGAEQWTEEIHVPQTIEGAFAQGAAGDDRRASGQPKTAHNGSMYSSSVTTGDFEQFIARDVVAFVDAQYRTIPERAEPRPRRSLDGRLRRGPDRDEARRRVRQPVHDEPLLPLAAGRRAREAPSWRRPRRP